MRASAIRKRRLLRFWGPWSREGTIVPFGSWNDLYDDEVMLHLGFLSYMPMKKGKRWL